MATTVFLHYLDCPRDNNPNQLEWEFIPAPGDVLQLNSSRMYLVKRRFLEWTETGLRNIHIGLSDLGHPGADGLDWSALEQAIRDE